MQLLALLPLALSAQAAEVDVRAAELARLRGEVEALSHEVVVLKEDQRSRIQVLEAQRLEIEVQIRREELRLAQIQDDLRARQDEIAQHVDRSASLVPALVDGIAALRASVETGLPFRLAERLQELDTLRQQLDEGLITPETGVSRLWAFAEDELRLTRENGLDRQTVPVAGGEVLADVARLGRVALYFRTDGGQVGAAVRDGQTWRWEVFEARADQLAVLALFSKMQHGVRTGAFELPVPGGR